MKNFFKCQFSLVLVFFIASFSDSYSQKNTEDEAYLLRISTLENIDRNKSFQEVRHMPFKKSESKLINLGFGKEADWLKIELRNSTNKIQNKILSIAKPLQDSISLYSKEGNCIQYSGVMVFESDKPLTGASIHFPIELAPGAQDTYFIKAVSKYGKAFQISLESEQTYRNKERNELIIACLLLGALLTIGIYNILLSFGIKDLTYFYYALAILGSLAVQLTVRGFFKQFILADNLFLLEWFPPFIIAISVTILIIFCIKFLNTKKYSRPADTTLKILLILQPLFFVYEIVRMEVFGIYTTNKLVASGVMLFGIVALYSGISVYRNGNKAAKFFIYAWTIYCISIIIYVGTLFAIVPINMITANSYMIGSVLEVILLSFALASRYKLLEADKYQLNSDLLIKEKELIHKKEEVISLMTESVQHLKAKAELANNLKRLSREEGVNLKSIMADLKSSELEDSKLLLIRKNIADINFEFIKRMKERHPNLSKTDLEICSFILIGLSRKEISNLRNTTLHAVKASRSRLKKKFELGPESSLDEYVNSIGQETKNENSERITSI